MSKAFVKDDAPLEDAADETLFARLGPGPRYMTPAGHARLVAERDALAEHHDRSEHHFRWLEAVLGKAVVVHPDPAHADRAYLGAFVTIEDQAGAERTVQLLGPDEDGGVSVDAPLGRALLGRSEGDEVVVEIPAGRQRLVVVGVRYV